jgi:hypothetical protein
LSERPDLSKYLRFGGIDPIPQSDEDALNRELISFIPIVGDAFLLSEAIEAFQKGYTAAGVIYALNFIKLIGPDIVGTHLAVRELYKRGGGRA